MAKPRSIEGLGRRSLPPITQGIDPVEIDLAAERLSAISWLTTAIERRPERDQHDADQQDDKDRCARACPAFPALPLRVAAMLSSASAARGSSRPS